MNQTTFSAKRHRKGRSAAFLMGLLLLCGLIVFNVILYVIPPDFTMFDVSSTQLTHISQTSETFAASLTEDITIYWLCKDGYANDKLSLFLTKYMEASEHISVVLVNTTTSPDFAATYTSATLSNYSLIVESARRYQVIEYMDMFYYTNDFVDSSLAGSTYKMSYSQYQELYATYGQDMAQTETHEYFQGEARLTSALDYVTSPQIPQPYIITGHGDRQMSDTLKSIMANTGISPVALELQAAQAIPSDASCVILFAPEEDLSAHEADLLKAYLQAGGSFLLVGGPQASDFTQLASVCALFGMAPTGGIVVDPTTNYYRGQSHLLVPLINAQHAAMYAVNAAGYPAYMPTSMGISIAETLPSGVSAQVLLGTSTNAYRVSKDSAQTPLCPPSSQYVAACGMLETPTQDGTADNAYLAWFASDEAFTDEAAKLCYNGNYYYLAMTARWMSETFVSDYATLEAVDLSTPMLDNITSTSAIMLGLIMVVVIPLGLLITGVIIWLKRRSR